MSRDEPDQWVANSEDRGSYYRFARGRSHINIRERNMRISSSVGSGFSCQNTMRREVGS
jgi:hypothetical protein